VKLRVKNASFIGRAVLEDTTVLSQGLVHNDANGDYRAYYLWLFFILINFIMWDVSFYTPIGMKMSVFRTLSRVVWYVSGVSEICTYYLLHHQGDDEGSNNFWNVGHFLPDDCLLKCWAVLSGKIWPMFQRCLLRFIKAIIAAVITSETSVISYQMTVFWDVGPCSLVETDRRFWGAYCGDGSTVHLSSVGQFLPDYAVKLPRQSSCKKPAHYTPRRRWGGEEI
jgi:hypothetical protein